MYSESFQNPFYIDYYIIEIVDLQWGLDPVGVWESVLEIYRKVVKHDLIFFFFFFFF